MGIFSAVTFWIAFAAFAASRLIDGQYLIFANAIILIAVAYQMGKES